MVLNLLVASYGSMLRYRFSKLTNIKKANARKRHDYSFMLSKYQDKKKLMLTFTYREEDPYKKMEIMISVKNYITKLILNTGSNDLKYYSNIELGDDFKTPHIHCQFFYDDKKQLLKIRDKVLSKFGLFSEFCHITEPKVQNAKYNYVIKDYRKNITDKELLLIDGVKKVYRDKLNKNIRFCSHSKEKYTKAIYRSAYKKGILKGDVDYLIDNKIIDKEINIIDIKLLELVKILLLVLYRIKSSKDERIDCFDCNLVEFMFIAQFEYWIFGKLWKRYSHCE